MTEKELSKYYWLKREIVDLESRIAELGSGLSATKYDNIKVSSSHLNSSIQEKIASLKNMLIEKRISALEEYIKIEKYIDGIEDSDIRLMFRLRFLDMKNYDEIGRKLSYHRTSVSIKIREYIDSHNSHKNVR